MLLKDKVCLITGAGKGIGRATLEAFIREGAYVYANDRITGSLDDCTEHPRITVQYFDVSDAAADKHAMLRIRKEQGRLDVLVNNAGIMEDNLIGMVTREMAERVFATNVFGAMELLQLAAKMMLPQRSGSIINISSIVGITGNPGQLVYSATKGAVIAMTKTAAKELGPRGIRVNAIAPGMIDTDMMRSVGADFLQFYVNRTPLGRLGRPEEIADACVYLASEMASYVTGHIMQVDASVIV